MPFRVKNGLSVAQQLFNQLFSDFNFVCIYFNDILVYSTSKKKHTWHLEAVFERFCSQQVYFKLSKCQFFLHQEYWLGHIISEHGIEVDDRKVEVIQKIETLQNISQVWFFFGFVNYYRRHLKNLAAIALPLTKLTKQDSEWKWRHEEQTLFNTIKRMITSASILRIADTKWPFIIFTNIFNHFFGGVLSQKFDGMEHSIVFCSQKLIEVE